MTGICGSYGLYYEILIIDFYFDSLRGTKGQKVSLLGNTNSRNTIEMAEVASSINCNISINRISFFYRGIYIVFVQLNCFMQKRERKKVCMKTFLILYK